MASAKVYCRIGDGPGDVVFGDGLKWSGADQVQPTGSGPRYDRTGGGQ